MMKLLIFPLLTLLSLSCTRGQETASADGVEVAITAGHSHTCAIEKAGNVVCWGDSDETEQPYYSVGMQLLKAKGSGFAKRAAQYTRCQEKFEESHPVYRNEETIDGETGGCSYVGE